MALLTFSAHCAKGHDRIDFTDREAFEAHMTGEHRAKSLTPGGAGGSHPSFGGRRALPAAPGWAGGKPQAPHAWQAPRAPKDSSGLARVLAALEDGKYDIKSDRYGWGGHKAQGALEQVA